MQAVKKQYEGLQREIVSKSKAAQLKELRAQLGHFNSKVQNMEDVKKYAQLLHSCGPIVSEEQDIIKITSKMAVGVLVEELVAGSSVESCMHDLKYAMETLGSADGQLSSAMQTVALHAELLTSTDRIKTYPSFEAMQDADKEGALSKKLITTWKSCNSRSGGLAGLFTLEEEKVLEKIRSLGWELMEGVCGHRQRALDERLKSQSEQLAAKTAVVAAWKRDLPADATWDAAVKAAQHLWKTVDAGKAVQTMFKKLVQY